VPIVVVVVLVGFVYSGSFPVLNICVDWTVGLILCFCNGFCLVLLDVFLSFSRFFVVCRVLFFGVVYIYS